MQPKTPAQENFFHHAAILRRGANATGHAEDPSAEFPGRTRRLPEGPSVAWGMQETLEKGSETSVTGVQYGPLASIRYGVSAVFPQYGIHNVVAEQRGVRANQLP